MDRLFWDVVTCEQGDLYVLATQKGMAYIGTPNAPFKEVELWAKKVFPKAVLEENQEIIAPYKKELEQYFKGEIRSFTIATDVKGTTFQHAVWEALKELPYGTTTTYSGIAERIGNPKAVRAVGTAIGANPLLAVVPCHRVIGKNGKMTGFRAGIPMKEYLLELER